MSAPIQMLHLEDVELDSELVRAHLRSAGLEVELFRVASRDEFERSLDGRPVDLVLSDFTLPGFDGLAALAMAKRRLPDTPFIFFSGTIGEERAVMVLKSGADDYVFKDHPARLSAAIRGALHQRDEHRLRKAAEAKVHEQAAILDRLADAVFVTDLDRRIVFWNRSAERIFGVPAFRALGHDAADVFGATGSHVPTASEIAAVGEWRADLVFRPPGGAEILVESRWSIVRDAAGTPRSVFVINVDVTERRRLEERLMRAQRLESIGALAGGIAHDLNNLLAPILLSAQMLEMRVRDPELRPIVGTIGSSARRGADVVRQILSFARGSEKGRRPLELRQFIADTTEFLARILPRTIKATWSAAPDAGSIMADGTQVFQVLMNFAVNARDAMPDGGRIEISAARTTLPGPASMQEKLSRAVSGNFVALAVRDLGTGIAPEHLERIFEPFFSTKGEELGSGLGLATAAHIAESHGGAVGVVTQLGGGCTFSLYLPVVEAEGVSQEQSGAASATPCIVVVDDDQAIVELIQLILESSGYDCMSATSGVEAIGLCKKNLARVGLVIADLGMHGMDGPALAHALHELKPELPCVGITGEPDAGRERWRGEVVELVHKPFSARDLLAVVARHFPRRA